METKYFDYDKLIENIKDLFKKSGMSQLELHSLTKVHQGTISNIINNKAKNISADTIYKIANAFNVSTDYLFGLTDEKTTDKATKELCSTLGLSERSVEILSGGSNTVIATDTIERFSSIENNDEREDTIKKFIMFQTENIRFVLDKLVDDYIETYFSKESSLIDLLKSFYEAMAMSEEFVRFEDRETIKNKFLAVGEMNGCIVPFQIDIKNLLTDSAIGEISARFYSIKHNTMEEDKK